MQFDENLFTSLPDCAKVGEEEAGIFIGGTENPIKKGTLAVWRSCKRYDLPYLKIGRSVRYEMGALREFVKSRRRTHTGENK